MFQSFKSADDALQLASAPTVHDIGERDQATEECKGLWFWHRLHGGEAIFGEDVDVAPAICAADAAIPSSVVAINYEIVRCGGGALGNVIADECVTRCISVGFLEEADAITTGSASPCDGGSRCSAVEG